MDKKDIDAQILKGLSGKKKEDFKAGLRNMGLPDQETRSALRTSFKRLCPNATEQELDIMVSGEAPQDNKPEWGS